MRASLFDRTWDALREIDPGLRESGTMLVFTWPSERSGNPCEADLRVPARDGRPKMHVHGEGATIFEAADNLIRALR